MHAARILRATHAYTPMIKFVGPRSKIHYEPHAPAPHPASPPDIVDNFQSFLAKLQSSSSGASASSTPKGQSTEQSASGKTPGDTGAGDRHSSTGSGSSSGSPASSGKGSKPVDFENFWEAPAYLWQPKEVSEREIEAVMSGGATDIRSGA